ncbi:b683aaa2-0b78-4d70-93e4-6cab0d0e1002 [Thermothielavioides terrestris]|uniref:B683aaa2-0b78-4d70-93e4-6cab0d0e1002 n=1 Tax=Thermothielavioides terrestris TaxID=2587410 RepID=A0A3S4BPQ0_9PEZI|nr:b683aaa2-0b78-4d70-93e4-6cab0d0e1002 [Thermothielavioides terrestris]
MGAFGAAQLVLVLSLEGALACGDARPAIFTVLGGILGLRWLDVFHVHIRLPILFLLFLGQEVVISLVHLGVDRHRIVHRASFLVGGGPQSLGISLGVLILQMLELGASHVLGRLIRLVLTLRGSLDIPLVAVPPFQGIAELLERLRVLRARVLRLVGRALLLVETRRGALVARRFVFLWRLLAERTLLSLSSRILGLVVLHVRVFGVASPVLHIAGCDIILVRASPVVRQRRLLLILLPPLFLLRVHVHLFLSITSCINLGFLLRFLLGDVLIFLLLRLPALLLLVITLGRSILLCIIRPLLLGILHIRQPIQIVIFIALLLPAITNLELHILRKRQRLFLLHILILPVQLLLRHTLRFLSRFHLGIRLLVSLLLLLSFVTIRRRIPLFILPLLLLLPPLSRRTLILVLLPLLLITQLILLRLVLPAPIPHLFIHRRGIQIIDVARLLLHLVLLLVFVPILILLPLLLLLITHHTPHFALELILPHVDGILVRLNLRLGLVIVRVLRQFRQVLVRLDVLADVLGALALAEAGAALQLAGLCAARFLVALLLRRAEPMGGDLHEGRGELRAEAADVVV